jgi:hypothetical protein
MSSATDTERIGLTSIKIPRVDERPAKQCPPLRTDVSIPKRRESTIVSATSAGTPQRILTRCEAPAGRCRDLQWLSRPG